jgi:methylamine dehydrogenase heavy chain
MFNGFLAPPDRTPPRAVEGWARALLACVLGTVAVALPLQAGHSQVKIDPLIGSELPAKPGAHWVWVNDIVFHHMADGKAFLLDGDSGRMLGMLSTGFGFNGVVLPRNRSVILSPETYFSRGTRGTRTDVVSLYDPSKLNPVGEIGIPPKRASSLPMVANAALTDDDRFLLIYNFTPAQSITVVDLQTRKLVGEIGIAGCALVYPTGARRFFSLCSDGTALSVQLDETGGAAAKTKSPRLFDAESDPVTEKAVRDGNSWLFASFAGDIVPVETSGAAIRVGKRWSLTSPAERKLGWRPGGMQHMAMHAGSRRLYSLMHQGGADTHKDPGTEIWVYDLTSKQRTQRIALQGPATSIAVSNDAKPLLFSIFIGAPKVDVLDARSGRLLRSIGEIGFTPSTLVTY